MRARRKPKPTSLNNLRARIIQARKTQREKTTMSPDRFVEIDYCQSRKHNQAVCGDLFAARRHPEEKRVVAVLADGLGSGVKAGVLATLTGTIALRCAGERIDVRRTAAMIMDILPVCKERKIAYCTFTIVDAEQSGEIRVAEFENPPFVLLRDGRPQSVESQRVPLKRPVANGGREAFLNYSRFNLQEGDRLIFFSDGATQAGTGNSAAPLGWGRQAIAEFAAEGVNGDNHISARSLACKIVRRALSFDGFKALDDITVGVVHYRRPRHLLLVTGPPLAAENDSELARLADGFSGRRVVCGGTTAAILARELKRSLRVNHEEIEQTLPPTSCMEGFDLVAEGALTMAALVGRLEEGESAEAEGNAADRLARLLLDSDIVHFLVGTKVNDAHQEPDSPVEMDIRRNVIRRIRRLLEEKYCKETRLRLI